MRGTTLDVAAAWKEALLLIAPVSPRGMCGDSLPVKVADVLAASYAIVIVVYWLLPQGWLEGKATTRGELLALRHHLFPVAAYALGRLLGVAWAERWRIGWLVALTAVVVAIVGLVDLALIPPPVVAGIRCSAVPRAARLDYEAFGTSRRTGSTTPVTRRTRSGGWSPPFLSPLATAYSFVVALIYVVGRPFRWYWALLAVLAYAASCTRTPALRSQRSRSASWCSHSSSVALRPQCSPSCPSGSAPSSS